MSAIPAAILKRRPTWHPSQAPPPKYRPFAHKLSTGALSLAGPVAAVNEVDERRMMTRAVITTPDQDRVGDVVEPLGCWTDNFRLVPQVYFGHQFIPFPVGVSENPNGGLDVFKNAMDVQSCCWWHQKTREAVQIFDLVAIGALRGTSIAFNPRSEPKRVKGNAKMPYEGFHYDEWELIEWSFVGVPCNPYATVLREHLSRDKLAGDRIAPLVKKALEPLAEPKRAWLGWERRTVKEKYITHNGSKFVVHAESGKVLGTHDNAADAKRQLAAIEAHKHGGKAMASSSGGTDGGYLGLGGHEGESSTEVGAGKHPHGVTGIEKIPEEHHETVKAIAGVMNKHKESAHPDGPHDAYFHPEEGHVYHHHHPEASEEHLDKVKGDMELIDGVHDLTQHHETPNLDGEHKGFHKVYEGLPGREGESAEEVTPKPEPAGETGEVKWSKALAKHFALLNKLPGRFLASKLLRRRLKAYLKAAKVEHKDVEECVKHKIPKLIAEGYAQDQAEAIAFSMCGEKKAFERSEEDGEEDGYDGDDGKEDGPALASLIADLVSCVVALQEHATPKPEPEREINDEEENQDDENDGDGKTQAERTNEAMARYQRSGKAEVKKMHPQHKEDLLSALGGASDHLHKMAHLEPAHFGRRHKEESLTHARTLDRHHGMISGMKDEPPERATDMPPDEDAGFDEGDFDEKTAHALLQKLEAADGKMNGLEASIRRINPSLLR